MMTHEQNDHRNAVAEQTRCDVCDQRTRNDTTCNSCIAVAERNAAQTCDERGEAIDTCAECGSEVANDDDTLCRDCNVQFEQREDERERTRMIATTIALTAREIDVRLNDCAAGSCWSCAKALTYQTPIVPCHDCAEACRKNSYGDIVCVNVGCNLFLI